MEAYHFLYHEPSYRQDGDVAMASLKRRINGICLSKNCGHLLEQNTIAHLVQDWSFKNYIDDTVQLSNTSYINIYFTHTNQCALKFHSLSALYSEPRIQYTRRKHQNMYTTPKIITCTVLPNNQPPSRNPIIVITLPETIKIINYKTTPKISHFSFSPPLPSIPTPCPPLPSSAGK
jgi:hypothetical protein